MITYHNVPEYYGKNFLSNVNSNIYDEISKIIDESPIIDPEICKDRLIKEIINAQNSTLISLKDIIDISKSTISMQMKEYSNKSVLFDSNSIDCYCDFIRTSGSRQFGIYETLDNTAMLKVYFSIYIKCSDNINFTFLSYFDNRVRLLNSFSLKEIKI